MSYWKKYWNKVAESDSLLKQVQRDAIDAQQMEEICVHISQVIDLKATDELLDVCCGNGLISSALAENCTSVMGVDFSHKLIDQARESQKHNMHYVVEDALCLTNSIDQRFDKIVLYFSFQYFDFKQGLIVIGELKKLLKPGGVIYIGDVPNARYFWTYYDTFMKRLFYFKQWLFKQPKMGKFWSEQEVRALATANGLKVEMRTQPNHLPHAHYRFDIIFRKN